MTAGVVTPVRWDRYPLDVETFGSAEVCEQTGATIRQVDYWRRHGLFPHATARKIGSGHSARFTALDVQFAQLAQQIGEVTGGVVPAFLLDGLSELLRVRGLLGTGTHVWLSSGRAMASGYGARPLPPYLTVEVR